MEEGSHTLYFLAILPSEDILAEVTRIKESFKEKYSTKAALKSPPHITLHMPFRWKPEKEDVLHKFLAGFAAGISSFPVKLDGYGSFPPRVIYLHVNENPAMDLSRKALVTAMRTGLHILNANYKDRPFRPHMTVAFRDLKKPDFYLAWNEVKNKPAEYTFQAHALTLLKNTGGKWEVYRQYPFQP